MVAVGQRIDVPPVAARPTWDRPAFAIGAGLGLIALSVAGAWVLLAVRMRYADPPGRDVSLFERDRDVSHLLVPFPFACGVVLLVAGLLSL
ncbi:MAG: hypothetical protein ACYDCL_13980 [Myxococcales bacterium]